VHGPKDVVDETVEVQEVEEVVLSLTLPSGVGGLPSYPPACAWQ
jgi:hypothetical protein